MKTTVEICVELALAHLPSGVADQFALAPIDTLRDALHLKVSAVQHLADSRSDGGVCDGVSFLKDGVLLYRETRTKRDNFTIAHELGHWLVDQTDEIYDRLYQGRDPAKMLETVCDHIAQRLLIRDQAVRGVIDDGPISARHVMTLADTSMASGPACAIALAARLPVLGAVAVLDRNIGKVEYASIRPDEDQGWPKVFPWPGQPVPAGHPLSRLRDGQTLTRKSYWEAPWGERSDYYLDAVVRGRRIVVVFADVDLWGAEKLHLDAPREFDQRPLLYVNCCGETRKVRGYPCPECRQPYCPKCALCRCQRQAASESPCIGCYVVYRRQLLVDGRCEDCRR